MTVETILKKLLNSVPEDLTISDKEYQTWKEKYESLKDYEKVDSLLCVLVQWLEGDSCRASSSVLASAVICISRWVNEKEMEDF